MKNLSSHVLIIDDDHIYCLVLEDMLVSKGYQVKKAYNVQYALMLLKENPDLYDIIILDIKMPGLSGLHFLKMFKGLFSSHSIPIIVLTSHLISGQLEKIKKLGVVDILYKPIEEQALLALMEKSLQNKLLYEAKIFTSNTVPLKKKVLSLKKNLNNDGDKKVS